MAKGKTHSTLKVAQTEAIYLLKSMTGKVGSDIGPNLKLKDKFQDRSKSIEDDGIQIQNRSLSDPPLSDIDFKNKMVWV